MKKALLATGLLAGLCSVAQADAPGPWTIHLRGLYIDPANKSDAIPTGLIVPVPKDVIDVSSKGAPDIDFDYRLNDRLSFELLLTIPQKHNVTVPSLGLEVGTFKHLPPTLTAKWHFLGARKFDPYLGAGINLTLIMSDHLAAPAGVVPGTTEPVPLELDSTSVGAAAQAGFDIDLNDRWTFTADVKWVDINSDVRVKASGDKVTSVQVDPMLYAVGIGYRF